MKLLRSVMMNILITLLRLKTSRVRRYKDNGDYYVTTERAITLSEVLKDIEDMYEKIKDTDYKYLVSNSEIVMSNLRAILS